MPEVTVGKNHISVKRVAGDPKARKATGWGGQIDPDSTFLYSLKPYLEKALGEELVKRRLSADGHMMGDDYTQYLRSKKISKRTGYRAIVNGQWAVRSLVGAWNETGAVSLELHRMDVEK